ncbi:MAG TPA: GTPase HflX [Longimicrobiales bacterium]|nr:GTPase HflX [Longimicrobiales bacterium]
MKETTPTTQPLERVILVAAPLKDLSGAEAREHLEELGRLTDTAGAEVVGTLQQRLDSPHPKLYIGEGKAGELRQLIEQEGATLIIFDDELSPAQSKNLEDLLRTRVMDRAELILDIFATRARSAEAQMQVELAQLQYMLPRLKRMWTHLTRGGGIGFRGPGETQLETDRRMIGRRISELGKKLEVVAQRRATQRKGRAEEFRAALVGYTNAGKSSVLRALSGAEVFVEDRLFATLDPATRAVELEPGARVLVTDTVGFIRKLPHHLVASFRATLEEVTGADLLVHVIDAAHERWLEQKQVVDEVLAELGVGDRPQLLLFNKVDQLTHSEEESLRARAAAFFEAPAVLSSTIEPDGLAELRAALLEQLRRQRPEVRVRLPAVDGETLASLYRDGEVLQRSDDGAVVEVIARLPLAVLGRLRARSVSVEPV